MPKKDARVALVKGSDRYHNLRRALELIAEDVRLEGARNILLKPNLISVSRQEACTHRDALRAVLDFLGERTRATIIVGEGSGTGSGDTGEGFRHFGYLELARDYPVRFVDLNRDETVAIELWDHRLRPRRLRLARTVVEADFRISLALPKTHTCVTFTGAIKNMAMGSLVRRKPPWFVYSLVSLVSLGNRRVVHWAPDSFRVDSLSQLGARLMGNDKVQVHQGYPVLNLNLFRLAQRTWPHLAVIDGFQGMEGEGPEHGEPVEWGIAIASADALAADCLAVHLMGFDPDRIGYLHYCHRAGLGQGDSALMEVVGESPQACARLFKPPPAYPAQLNWALPSSARLPVELVELS